MNKLISKDKSFFICVSANLMFLLLQIVSVACISIKVASLFFIGIKKRL